MKRTLHSLVALVVAAAVSATPAAAQNLNFFVGGGAAFGMQDLSEDTGTGWIGFAGAGVPISSVPGAVIGLTGFYAHIPYESVDAATNIPGLFADLGYVFGATTPNKIKPYIRFGAGVMQHRYSTGGSYSGEDSETKAGGAIGAGLNYVMPSVTPFIGVHFVTGGSDTSVLAAYLGFAFGGSKKP
ncbi:MAG TPA: outer membrane beta-barrel protein [Gemmatimonadaceae bacterium]|nr:outer membrane beta-barrel protein [Gemmatimonadaceae bacterium]